MTVHDYVSFLLINDSTLLVNKSCLEKKIKPESFNFPSFNIKLGENKEDALVRIFNEELNINPTSYKFLCSVYQPGAELKHIHYYIVSDWEDKNSIRTASESTWYPLQHNLPLGIKSDKVAIAEYQKQMSNENPML